MEGVFAFHALLDLAARKAELEKQLDDVKEQIAFAQAEVLDYMQNNGMQSVKLGGNTIYLRRDIYASTVEGEDALSLVRDHGYGDAVRTVVNAQTASSIVRELIKDLAPDEPIPQWVQNAFRWTDKITPAIRKA